MNTPFWPGRSEARRSNEQALAWNDIEALPAYGAALLGLFFLLMVVADLAPVVTSTTLKTVGIVASVALSNAWMRLNDEVMDDF